MIYVVLASMLLVIVGLMVWLKPLWIMNYLLSPRVSSTRIKDIRYGEDPRQQFDVYLPDHIDRETPCILFVHGGAWDTGHKDEYAFVGRAMTELGCICIIPTYRLYPSVQFPHFIDDIAMAIMKLPSLLSEHAELISNNGIMLMGHSAGAHTGAMLLSNPSYLAQSSVRISGFIGLAGPYDLPLDDPLVVGKFDGVELHDVSEQHVDEGHEHNAHDANPINWVGPTAPPILLIHGKDDVTVGPYHSERFAKRLAQLGIKHQLIMLEKVNHRVLVGGLCKGLRWLTPAYEHISDFIRQHDSRS